MEIETDRCFILIRFAAQLGYTNFEANTGFLSHFAGRKGLSLKKASGESASVSEEETSDYINTVLRI